MLNIYQINNKKLFYFSGHNFVDVRRTSTSSGNGGLLGHLSKSTIMSVFVILLLVFLFCSSLYLVFRIDALQRQVSKQYFGHCSQLIVLDITKYILG